MAYGTASTAPDRHGGRVKTAISVMLVWIALMWILEAVDVASGNSLDVHGIEPREPGELRDIVPAAFLHFGFDHLMANTVPLLVLGFVAALRGIRTFAGVVTVIVLASGLGVWLTSPVASNTAGASGVVFGLFGYLVVRGFVDRRMVDVLIGVIVVVLYGSILWGVLPTASGVSWQGHLFGLVGGVLAAFFFRTRGRLAEARP